jgi:hypothetical protein
MVINFGPEKKIWLLFLFDQNETTFDTKYSVANSTFSAAVDFFRRTGQKVLPRVGNTLDFAYVLLQ